jgi:ligand-binding sensor domain-containing protein
MDETKVGLVLLADGMFKGIEQVDAALADRVSVRLTLSHFTEGEVWNAFLGAFCKKIDVVDMKVITTEDGAQSTYMATEGNRRSFRRLMSEGVLIAVDDCSKVLTSRHLQLAFERTRGDGSSKANPYAA